MRRRKAIEKEGEARGTDDREDVFKGEVVEALIGVYVNKDLDGKLEQLKEWMEDAEKGVRVLVGRDNNARAVREGKGEV